MSRHWMVAVLAALVAPAAWAEGPAPAAATVTPATAENETCLGCHKDRELLEIELPSGELKNMYVDGAQLAASVHQKLACTDCHADLKGSKTSHKEATFKRAREFTLAFSDQCKQCHFANYTKTLDGVHHTLIEKGNPQAAVCADCHGSHGIQRPGYPRASISKTCAKCHAVTAATFMGSVHGEGLKADNPDVPVCTDCHKSHAMDDPKSSAWLLAQPQMCGNCHTDERRMKRYGLSTRVVSTYVADFHGTTTKLQKGAKNAARPITAVCTDCHGVHDITRADAPNSKVLQANLVKTCATCHPNATTSFPASWLSHYEPTWEKAPLVAAVNLFYAFLIPFMIGGLALQILLHLWRVVVNR
jgi:predicted CXXCH cytochrome family protein